jgi:hypothetical protein
MIVMKNDNIKTHLETKIQKNRKMLERWAGANARLVELTSSHTQLSILLTAVDRPGNLLLCCFPIHICAPISWVDAHLQMDIRPLEDGTYGVRIYDIGAKVEIVADEFQISENIKRWTRTD